MPPSEHSQKLLRDTLGELLPPGTRCSLGLYPDMVSTRQAGQVGGGGNAPTVSTNTGYYALTTGNASVFTQTASTGPAGYLSTNINIFVKTNGAVGSNGDVGNVVTIYTVWDEIPDGLTVGTGSTTTVTIVPPENTYLPSASWGTPTVTGSVSVL